MISPRIQLFVLTAALGIVQASCGADTKNKKADTKVEKAETADPKPGPAASNEHALKVTTRGFEPQDVAVSAGEPVTLLITRTTDKTCANEIVIDGTDVNVKLPLNEQVKVSFTPSAPGELKYGCAMDKMVGGVIRVR